MRQPFEIKGKFRLKDFDPDYCGGLEKEPTKEKTLELGQRIGYLQELLYANARHALIILFQGMDASGKDGAVKRVLEFVNPAGVETANFKVPSAEERAHDFLWRHHKAVPRYGNIGVFNRSHYEAVLVERVLELVPKDVWKARYEQINAFEKILAGNNVIVLKFFLHVSKGEQAERLRARLKDPTKNWKFSSADLQVRRHWDDYMEAYEDALNECSTKHCRWHVVPANAKWYRDFVVARRVVEALEELKMDWPKPKEDLSKVRIA
ncbi:MAG TPA: PPK2 family polyphosphate kinase [Verrucomicrobiae bacterium]|jgi:PPK2 family polyphosphate:nucleotide phosphotransferase